MGAVLSLVLTELGLITLVGLTATSAYYNSCGGKSRTLDIISAVVGTVVFILSLVIAIFLL
jgi:hypothetical protein